MTVFGTGLFENVLKVRSYFFNVTIVALPLKIPAPLAPVNTSLSFVPTDWRRDSLKRTSK